MGWGTWLTGHWLVTLFWVEDQTNTNINAIVCSCFGGRRNLWEAIVCNIEQIKQGGESPFVHAVLNCFHLIQITSKVFIWKSKLINFSGSAMLHPAVLKSRQQKKRLVGFNFSFFYLFSNTEFDYFFQCLVHHNLWLWIIILHVDAFQKGSIEREVEEHKKTTPLGHTVHVSTFRWRCSGWWWQSSWCAGRPTTSTSSSPSTFLRSPARSGSPMSTWRCVQWAYFVLFVLFVLFEHTLYFVLCLYFLYILSQRNRPTAQSENLLLVLSEWQLLQNPILSFERTQERSPIQGKIHEERTFEACLMVQDS